MNAQQVKGYCPGALRPMVSGDGLVVRVRPPAGRLKQDQAAGIAALAMAHGNGRIDLSARANLQIRGVREHSYPPLLAGLRDLSLIDESAESESRRNIIVAPFWGAGDETVDMAEALAIALASEDAPELPGKFGFAVDTGHMPVLQNASGDIRLERDAGGALILCAEGAAHGKPVTAQNVVPEAMKLARWFMKSRTTQNRVARLLADGATLPAEYTVPRQTQVFDPAPSGALVAMAFGQIAAETLSALAKQGDLRLTPWRMVLVETDDALPKLDGVITDPRDPLLRITACTGAPDCVQAHARTRPLARQLAAHLKPDQTLHISGCAKGCAHPKAAPLTLTATSEGFDLIRDGCAHDAPQHRHLSPEDIIKAL
ncbi:MAG: precorrin-3B synthase [Pseudomonadota bacterium]